MDDEAIAAELAYVAKAIDVVPSLAPRVDSRLEPPETPSLPTPARPQATTGDAAYLRAARDAFGRKPWTLKQLAQELKIGDTSAGVLRDAWLATGSCRQVNLGRWSFDTAESGT